ncbi:hypothetical protein WJ96_03940 [Burkholderia ubonensis]|uniref:Uncharacterized protein n=1 Tax=Burkholderia ubonensis TaxID=101571 RepID=A0AAW3MS02_9BURK|nr:hypothetical protein [Burkholderia ubonensis]KVP65526.1 hypothetical protein WJ93_23685 [Burkholderia ubonensis]KVP97726.1 hypothetical protein WJ96_03940 [Burkholderia ubonensis]KVZ92423.1 hypothetical protein WL25_15595 [Burkholderia ubonensis]
MQDAGIPAVDQGGITLLEHYLSGRKQLIAGREVLFMAARTYLRPSQRPDARQLGDALWNSPARDIADDEWVVNAARGYLSILENAEKGRSFRLCVLQQGYELRIGVRVPAWYADTVLQSRARIVKTFGAHAPVLTQLTTGEVLVDWHFRAEQLYTQAQAMEDAVYRISAVFECALQSITPKENTLQ